MDFQSLYALHEPDLKEVETKLLSIFQSRASLIPAIGLHIMQSGGKRIRPLFLLITSEILGYKEKDRILFGSIIEAIHTASLLHDDVVDSAMVRRGQPTAHSLWGNQIVILVGDFLYANALRMAVNQKNQLIMERLSAATTLMTEGELLQLGKVGDPDITEDEYMKIIAGKTGALISAACAIGGILADAAKDQVEALADFGLRAGMAFQMADDILDYAADQHALGKKLGKDLEEGKITSPIIELLASVNENEKTELREIISSANRIDSSKRFKRIFELFKKYDTINISMKKASQLVTEAKEKLTSFDSAHDTEPLQLLADYALVRER